MRLIPVIGADWMMGTKASALSKNGKDTKRAAIGENYIRLTLQEGCLRFCLPARARAGVITLFANDGIKLVETLNGPWEAGAHRIGMPDLGPGLYHLRIDMDPFTVIARLVHTRDWAILTQKVLIVQQRTADTLSTPALLRTAGTAVNKLVVRKARYHFTSNGSPMAGQEVRYFKQKPPKLYNTPL